MCLSPLLTLLSVKANLILDSTVALPLASATTTSPAAEAVAEDDSHLSNSLVQVLLSAPLVRFAINKVTLPQLAGSVLTKGITLKLLRYMPTLHLPPLPLILPGIRKLAPTFISPMTSPIST
jgi:hypothetical protein